MSGRRWKLPEGEAEEARAKLLSLLGINEQAVVDAPPKGQRENVLAELWASERTWLCELSHVAGLTKNPSPARALRAIVRAAIVNRDLLPFQLPLDPEPPWMHEDIPPIQERLGRWLDALPLEVLAEVGIAVRSAIARRKK